MAIFPFHPLAVALFQYLQPSTQYAWSLDFSPQSITLRRATLGKNTGVGTFVSATTAETESAHVRRTLLAAGGFGGDTSLLRCTFAPVRGTPWPSLIDFCCFRHHLDVNLRQFKAMAENCGNRSREGRPKLWAIVSRSHSRTVSPPFKSGYNLLLYREANLPAHSQPKSLCFKINVPRNRPLHLRMSTSHRYYKVKVVLGQSKS